MEELSIAAVPVKIEGFPSNHLKTEITEDRKMEENKFINETDKNGIHPNNGISTITVVPTTNLTAVPVTSQNFTSGHAAVVAQIAPMTSVVRNTMEEANNSIEAMQAALLINKPAHQELDMRNDCVPTSSPLTVTVVPSSVTTGNTTINSTVGGSGRSNSNPDHIKRPMNAFLIWSTARRHKIKLEEPNITMAEISKRLGEEWKNMGCDERQPFVDQSKQLREEHMAKYPDYKYQPRRRKTHSNSCSGNFSTNPGKIKSIKTTPSIYPSTSSDVSFQQQTVPRPPQQQQPQQDQQQQSQIQGRHQNFQGIIGHQEQQIILTSTPTVSSASLSNHSLQQHQEPLQSSSSEVLVQHQNIALNNSNNAQHQQPINQQQQQSINQTQAQPMQQIQAINGNVVSTSTQQVNQWPSTIYPGLTLMGYHMTNNGMVPLYAPTQPMLPVISLPTGPVGTVLQPNNTTTVAVNAGQQQHQAILQQQEQRPVILTIDTDKHISAVKTEIHNDVKPDPVDLQTSANNVRPETSDSHLDDVGGKPDSKPPVGEVLSYSHI